MHGIWDPECTTKICHQYGSQVAAVVHKAVRVLRSPPINQPITKPRLTLQVRVVAVVHKAVRVGALAQEALLVPGVHVLVQLVLAVVPLAAEPAEAVQRNLVKESDQAGCMCWKSWFSPQYERLRQNLQNAGDLARRRAPTPTFRLQ